MNKITKNLCVSKRQCGAYLKLRRSKNKGSIITVKGSKAKATLISRGKAFLFFSQKTALKGRFGRRWGAVVNLAAWQAAVAQGECSVLSARLAHRPVPRPPAQKQAKACQGLSSHRCEQQALSALPAEPPRSRTHWECPKVTAASVRKQWAQALLQRCCEGLPLRGARGPAPRGWGGFVASAKFQAAAATQLPGTAV